MKVKGIWERLKNIKDNNSKLANVWERLKSFDGSNLALFGIFLYMMIKAILFVLIGSSDGGYMFAAYVPKMTLFPAHIAFIAVLVFPVLYFKNRKQLGYLFIVDLIFSIYLIVDLWYYRAAGEYLGLRHIFYPRMFNPMNKGLINISPLDILFIIDLPVIGLLFFKAKGFINKKRHAIIGTLGILVCIIVVVGTHTLFDVKKVDDRKTKFMTHQWGSAVEMRAMGPIGYLVYEGYNTLEAHNRPVNEAQIKQVNEWFANNKEDLPKNSYYGMFKGKNVIFVQMESLEDFVLNQKVYGQTITPVMNELIKHSLYFDNFYEQNNGGNSIDCDMMANTGMLTLGGSITFIENPYSKYPSMARVVDSHGYESASTHAEKGGDFNWSEAHGNALGFEKMWGVKDYNVDEVVGFGLSDRSFYKQYTEKLKTLKQPFYSTIPNLSNHGPFEIKDKYKDLKLPKDLDDNRLGGYFQSVRYADTQLGVFIENLKKEGLLKNTVLVIYGDHGGVHKYYTDSLKDVKLEGDWWKEYEKKVPLIIYGEGIKPKTINTIGGHIDIMPTVLYLLGMESKMPLMGRNLLNTNVDATVIKGNEIIGNPSKKEREHLLKAYKIAKYIIDNNYYKHEYGLN